MEKEHASPLSFFFPWLSPLIIKFTISDGGIEFQIYKNNQLQKKQPARLLRRALPASLIQWMEDHHIENGLQPYPLVKQLWQRFIPFASRKLIIDASALASLEEGSQPEDFALVWKLNQTLECIQGHYEGIDHYLGMGWFQKGTKIWSNNPSDVAYSQFENPKIPVEQAEIFLKSILPDLQRHLPTRANFQFIADFSLQVHVSQAKFGRVLLTVQCNYPQLLSTIKIPQQKIDVLLAEQAVIHFSYQAIMPVIKHFLEYGTSIALQDVEVPLFIKEQLPALRLYALLKDAMAEKILQTNPIVSLATLKPTISYIHSYKEGIGQYVTDASYHYQQHTLDMSAVLAALQRNQRFVQQHDIWFEWPVNSSGLFNTIRAQLVPQVLQSVEIMGIDTRRTASLQKQLTAAHAIQLEGTTSVRRSQALFKQLRHHGIPGVIVNEPKEMVSMLIDACEQLVSDNRQTHILWLVPTSKKGAVTRALKTSFINSYVRVASLVTLRDEPALTWRSWTLVIFQQVDHLLDGSPQSKMFPQLQWLWALASVTSRDAINLAIMPVLHIPEQYYKSFCARYLFDVEKSYQPQANVKSTASLNAPQPVFPGVTRKEETAQQHNVSSPSFVPSTSVKESAASVKPTATPTSMDLTPLNSAVRQDVQSARKDLLDALQAPIQQIEDALQATVPRIKVVKQSPIVQTSVDVPAMPTQQVDSNKATPKPVSSFPHRTIELNLQAIVQLQQESERLQDRLTVEDEAGQELLQSSAELVAVHVNPQVVSRLQKEGEQTHERLIVEDENVQMQAHVSPSADPEHTASVHMSTRVDAVPVVDEEWQQVLQQWKPEHWEIITLVYQGQLAQLKMVENKVHRPVSRLFDEINAPVDEYLGDLLIDSDTRTIASHLYGTAEYLVRWYLSSQR